jgi:hypothetical protein
MHTERTATTAASPGTFRPASGGSSPALEAAISNVIEGDVLSAEAEAKVIADRWNR